MMIILKKYSEYEDDVMWRLENVFDRIAVSDLILFLIKFLSMNIFTWKFYHIRKTNCSLKWCSLYIPAFFVHSSRSLRTYRSTFAYIFKYLKSFWLSNCVKRYNSIKVSLPCSEKGDTLKDKNLLPRKKTQNRAFSERASCCGKQNWVTKLFPL